MILIGEHTMKHSKNKIPVTKDKIIGEVKEAIGKVSGNEELELKGKDSVI